MIAAAGGGISQGEASGYMGIAEATSREVVMGLLHDMEIEQKGTGSRRRSEQQGSSYIYKSRPAVMTIRHSSNKCDEKKAHRFSLYK